MAKLTRHQAKIVERYYTHRDTIMLTRLQELVTELYLASADADAHGDPDDNADPNADPGARARADRTRTALWKRARKAMENLGVKPGLIDHIVGRQDPEILARNLQGWLEQSRTGPGPPSTGR